MERILAGLVRGLWRLGWGVFFVPVTLLALLALSSLSLSPLTVIAAIGAVILAFRAPALARDLVPAVLIGLGLFGIWLAARFALGRHWGAYSILLYGGGWHALVMLLLALGFLAAGLWLAPRTGLYPRCRRVLSRARWSAPGWGLLLIPLAAACFGLFGSTPWTWGFAVFAVLAAVLLPVLAADLAPFGLLLLGLYAIRLPSLSSHSTVARFLRKSWVVVQPAPTRAQQIQALQLRQHAAALMNQAAALQRQAAGLLRQAMQLNGKAAGPAQWRMTAGRLQVQAIGPGGGPGVVKGQGFVTAVPFRGPGHRCHRSCRRGSRP